ncbi:MAG: AAA family ATPase [Paludibacteraceae bacterium]|nr:AAA family ATPase [Paludibacteraceae bacterium]
MLEDFIIRRIRAELPFVPNEEKEGLFRLLGAFLVSPCREKCFLLKGYAGTGKTSVVSALVRALEGLQQPCILLAPTGRAAKVLARYSGKAAFTIHKYIYRQQQLGVEAFSLADNRHKQTLFIVDEASMLSATRDNGVFGSGSLMDDLIKYVYSGDGCSLFLLGDDAQLPPVGSDNSPALDTDRLRGYGLEVFHFALTQVARQALDSGILANATLIREQLTRGATLPDDTHFPTPAHDVQSLSSNEFIDTLEQAYREVGEEETLIITRSNKRTNLFNQGVRARILWKEDELSAGDRLMVCKNNYFWTKDYENLPFIANGDMFEVVRLRHEREMYGFRFVEASLRAMDYDFEIDCMLWIDSLLVDSPADTVALQKQLFTRIAEDYPEIRNRKELTKKIFESPYYNALQVRFAYAVTCHKAQGGQWKRVFLDLPLTVSSSTSFEGGHPMQQREYLRWLYTAVTRATETLFVLQ